MFTPVERRNREDQGLVPSHREYSVTLAPFRLLLTSGSKESPIAWLMAVWSPVVLGTERRRSLRVKGAMPHKPAIR